MRCFGQYNGVIAANMSSLSCRLLVAIIREAQNPTVLAVAAHDLGEYVRYYPRGKKSVNESSPVVCVETLFSLASLSLSLFLSSLPRSLPPSLSPPSLSPPSLSLPSLPLSPPSLSLSPPSLPLSLPSLPLSLPSLSPSLSLPPSLPPSLRIIDQMGAKELVMGLVQHTNNEVRMQALLSIQKMMVQNW